MAVHVAEMYAALVAQRRQLFGALAQVSPARLIEDVDLDHRSVLGTLFHIAHVEREQVAHRLRGQPSLDAAEFLGTYLGGSLSLDTLEAGWARVASETRDYIRREKPYELVFPRKDLGGTPELLLWHVVMHEMAHLGELVAARHRLGIDLPELAPVNHLRRNPELGRWWMAEKY